MSYLIYGKWADWFWSSETGRSGMVAKPSSALLRFGVAPRIKDGVTVPSPFCSYPGPMQLVVDGAGKRLFRDDLEVRVASAGIPSGAFWALGEGWYVAGPELAFLELANRLSLEELIAAGYEYCGTYAIDPLSGEVAFDLEPATSKAKLERFLGKCGKVKGIENAQRAVKYVSDKSASTMETSLHVRSSLPSRMGGYPSPFSLLNHEVELTPAARRIYRHAKCRFDMYYPGAELDVEYHGRDHEQRMESDYARDAALKVMGYETMVVTRKQYNDFTAMGEVFRTFSAKHGIYVRKQQVRYTSARGRLYHRLLVYQTGKNRR